MSVCPGQHMDGNVSVPLSVAEYVCGDSMVRKYAIRKSATLWLFCILCINFFFNIWHIFSTNFGFIICILYVRKLCQGGWMICQKSGSQNLKQSLHYIIWCATFYSKVFPIATTTEMLQHMKLGSQFNILLNSFMLSYFFIGDSTFILSDYLVPLIVDV